MNKKLILDSTKIFTPTSEYLKEKYKYYNKLFFSNKLPNSMRFYYTKIESNICGLWKIISRFRNFNEYYEKLEEYEKNDKLKNKYKTKELYDEYLSNNVLKEMESIYINNMFPMTEKTINEILLHEMIHSYTYNSNKKDMISHGYEFIKKMLEINNKIKKMTDNMSDIEITTQVDVEGYTEDIENAILNKYKIFIISYFDKKDYGIKKYKYICIEDRQRKKAIEYLKKYIEENGIKEYKSEEYSFKEKGFYTYDISDKKNIILSEIPYISLKTDIDDHKIVKDKDNIFENKHNNKRHNNNKIFKENNIKNNESKNMIPDEIDVLCDIEEIYSDKVDSKIGEVEITDIRKIKDKQTKKNKISGFDLEITIA